MSTQKVSLAGKWHFQIDPYKKGVEQSWWLPETSVAHWDKINVPGVWDIYDKYNDYTGDAWYRYEFEASDHWFDQEIQLVFDSVYHDADVWLNGEHLGSNHLGFLAFDFDVSGVLKEKGMNTLVLKVNNRFKRGAVWNWGGIRRPVYIELNPHSHIENVFVTPVPNLEEGTAKVEFNTKINTTDIDAKRGLLRYRLTKAGKAVVSFESAPFELGGKNKIEQSDAIELPAELVDLWHFNDPTLYHVEASLYIDGELTHQMQDRFGIRKVEVKDNAFYLNGEQVRLVGFNMVPEDRFDGNALPLSRIKEDVDLLKSLNANFARLSGPVLPEEYVDYLDEVGFLLVEEVGLWGKDKLVDPEHPLPKEWLKRLVSDHYNHPSVIAWSVGNEIGDVNKNPKVMEYVEGAIAHSKELDPTRLAVYISYSADYQKNDPSKYSDMVMFNKYANHEERLEVVREYYPEKPIFFSEIGTNLDGVDPNDSIFDPEQTVGPLRKHDYLMGTSHFAFSDYRSTWYDEKPEWTTDFSQNRAWGVLTSYRNPKRSFKKFQNFNSPLNQFEFDVSGETHTVHLQSRSLDSFPAYTMTGYRLVWVAENEQGQTLEAGQIALPVIAPGDKVSNLGFKTRQPYAKISLNLLSPLGHVSQVLVRYRQVPASPRVLAVNPSLDTIRVEYELDTMAEEYQLIAVSPSGKVTEGQSTINHFAEVSGLEPNTPYRLELKAKNSIGDSTASKGLDEVITTPNELPPIIWAVKGKGDAFHIGFSVGRNDFKYEIQYGLTPGEYTRQFLVNTRGATRISAIKNGEQHYFRLRRLITGRTDSDWTREYKVVLRAQDGLDAPEFAYAIPSEHGLVIYIKPVSGATGYRLDVEGGSGNQSVDINMAYSSFVVLRKFNTHDLNTIRISTLDEYGIAGESAIVKQAKSENNSKTFSN